MAMTGKAASSSDQSSKGGTAYLATQSTFLAIATILAMIMVYVRSIVVKKSGVDDTVVVLALVSTLVTNTNRKRNEIRCKCHGAFGAYVNGLAPRGHVTLSSPLFTPLHLLRTKFMRKNTNPDSD